MKVLVYNNCFFERSETFIHQQVSYLESAFEFFLVGYTFENTAHFPLKHAHLIKISQDESQWNKLLKKIKWKLGYRFALGALEERTLVRLIQDKNIKLIHAHFGYNGVRILPIAKKLGIPLIVSFHGYDASGLIFEKPAYLKALPGLLDYASKILVVSNHMVENLRVAKRHYSKVELYPYAIDLNFFQAGFKQPQSSEVHILHSGRLVAKKGVPDLIRVVHDLHKNGAMIKLHVLGAGEEEASIKELVLQLALSNNVNFYGSQPHMKVKELMERADIFVLNSRTAENGDMEGLPVTLLEAMSMGKAIVSTYHAGIPYAIQDNVNGLLVDERNNGQLFQALLKLIGDRELRILLGNRARQTVEEKFDLNTLGKRLGEIYEEVLIQSSNSAMP